MYLINMKNVLVLAVLNYGVSSNVPRPESLMVCLRMARGAEPRRMRRRSCPGSPRWSPDLDLIGE